MVNDSAEPNRLTRRSLLIAGNLSAAAGDVDRARASGRFAAPLATPMTVDAR